MKEILITTFIYLRAVYKIVLYTMPTLIALSLLFLLPNRFSDLAALCFFGAAIYFNVYVIKFILPFDGRSLYQGNSSLMMGINLGIVILVLVLYYGLIYFFFYKINPHYFVCNTTDTLMPVDFIYFSTITFATVGYGDIYPNATSTRMITSVQVLNSIIILIFVVANFESLKMNFARFEDETKQPRK